MFFSKDDSPQLRRISLAALLLTFSIGHAQTTFTSVQSGDYTDPATWGTATAPTSADDIVVSAGNTVALNEILTANNVTVSGSLESSELSPDFAITGNLTVNSGGLLKGIYYYDAGSFGYNIGIQITVSGDITNNGRIDLSEGSGFNPEGVLKLNGSTVQTISGLGTFGGTTYTTDSSNTGAVINQLVIDNSSTSTPNVIWGFNNIKIKSAINLANARIDLGSNKMTIGNYGTATTSCASGNGFISGTIGRWYDAYSTFSQLTPGVDYNNLDASFPFISADGKSRTAFITRPGDTTNSAVSGELSVSYYDSPAVSTGFSVVDGAYTVTDILESAWVIEKDASYAFPAGNHAIAFSAQDAYIIKNGNSRIIKTDETTIGTHQTGTTTPFAQRTGLSDADLTNAFFIGYNAALDTPVTSVQSGNWNDAATWSTNSVPSCADTVTILSGHTVTSNTENSAAGVNIAGGATLISESSSLTVGCTNNNATFSNRGTYTISGGSLIVNGNVIHASGSTFNQAGGDIIVDGNNNGDLATSIDQTLFKIETATLNLTAGKITIVDPPAASTTLAIAHTATAIIPCTGFFCWYPTNITMDSTDGIAIGQIVVGNGVPAGTTVVNIGFDGSINTSPSLPATGLAVPISLSFYNVSSSPSAFVYESSEHYAAGADHTLQIGDGVSTDKSSVTTKGFGCNFRAGEGVLSLNNLIVDALDPENRFVYLDSDNANFNAVIMNVQNDFTILNGKVKGAGVDAYYGGNIVNNGELNVNNSTAFGNYIDGAYVETSKPQTISGTGTFNAQMEVILNTPETTGSVSQLKVNNTSPAGVTFEVPFGVVSGLTMTAGIIHTSDTSVLTIGTPAMAYTSSISGNFGETCYIDGPFSKDISGGQNAADLTNGSGFIDKFFFPTGKSSYTPIWVAVTTPAGGFGSPGAKIKVQAFDTNPGTASSNIAHLSQTRWEVSKIGGTVVDFNIKVGDAAAADNNIIVQAPSASGVYDNDFGITSTFEEGAPNTITSTTEPMPFDSLEGYFSLARQAECSVVDPGDTVAGETTVCAGKPVTLSLGNVVVGEGVSYQWQSSADGSEYIDIDGETATTCSVAPLADTYYRCNVTCSFSSSTVASTPILISLNNTITSTIPATICMPDNIAVLAATSSAGDVKWYLNQTGGVALSTGDTFNTPEITATTTFYAGTESATQLTAGLPYAGGSGSGTLNRGLLFNLSNTIVLNSVKVYPQQNPSGSGPMPITIKVLQNGVQVPGTSDVVFTPDAAADWSPTNVAQIVELNYALDAGNDYTLEITDGASSDNALAYLSPFPSPFPVSNGAVTILGGIDNGLVDDYGYYFFFDWDVTEICSSARIAVTATVQTAEECGLGNQSFSALTKVAAYPNPYSDTFRLDVRTNSTEDIGVKIYDMVGRLIANKTIRFNDLANVKIGSGYPSGVYNVVVTQENQTKALQIIKN